jgi:hypothetical protein
MRTGRLGQVWAKPAVDAAASAMAASVARRKWLR